MLRCTPPPGVALVEQAERCCAFGEQAAELEVFERVKTACVRVRELYVAGLARPPAAPEGDAEAGPSQLPPSSWSDVESFARYFETLDLFDGEAGRRARHLP